MSFTQTQKKKKKVVPNLIEVEYKVHILSYKHKFYN